MKNKVIKILIFIIVFIIFLGIKNVTLATYINSIEMDIAVYNNGNAEVTEIWECNSENETEWYKSYRNLGKSKITNFHVSDLYREYEVLDSWKSSASKSEKENKCGIHKIFGGLELCWGIGSLNYNKYRIKYNISNFVAELKDSQMMYWTLIPNNHPQINNIKIKIHSYKHYTTEVKGFGMSYGTCKVVDNNIIIMESNGKLKDLDYVAFLAKIPKGTFDTQNKLNKNFEYFLKKSEKSISNNNYVSFYVILIFVFTGIIITIVIIIKTMKSGISDVNSRLEYGFRFDKTGKLSSKEITYYRDIPLKDDILKAYYIAYQYNIIKFSDKEDILGAIILMWLKDGIVQIKKEITKTKEKNYIIMGDNPDISFKNDKINEIFKMMYEASNDGVLEDNEFAEWCGVNYEKIYNWFNDILKEQRDELVSDGLIKTKKGHLSKIYIGTQNLKNIAIELAGLKKFLLDYTLIKEREIQEVELFEDYLVYAQMFGIGERVSQQFKEIYPHIINGTNFDSYEDVELLNLYVSKGISTMRICYDTQNNSNQNYGEYSSDGGFSSGGGSGSFGSGGGIGAR